MYLTKNRAMACCALAMILAAPAAAHAQDDGAPDDSTDAATILVTAQRREERLVDVPISVTVVDDAILRARAVPDTEGAFATAPNVDITRTRNSGTEWNIAIRGVSNAAALNVDESVAVYIDDVFVSDSSGFNFELFDLASLEVLRGPQGTLYGRNAIGGALNIRTVAPGNEFGGRLSLLYGSDNELRAGAALDLPSGDGRWRTRIAGLYTRHDATLDKT